MLFECGLVLLTPATIEALGPTSGSYRSPWLIPLECLQEINHRGQTGKKNQGLNAKETRHAQFVSRNFQAVSRAKNDS